MKKIKLLLIALCGVLCASATACELPIPSGSSSASEVSQSLESDTQSLESDTQSEEESVPEGKMLATVYYYTIQHNDEPLTYSGLIDEDATLNEFFTEHLEGIKVLYNEVNGYEDEEDAYYDDDFFKEGFWQIGNRLQYGDSVLSDSLPEGTDEFDMSFTASGWGMNIGICVCENPLEPDWMEACIPFPIGVCIEDFVNWAYAHDFFTMSYEQSLTQGYWAEAGYTEHLDSTYLTGSNLLCFVYGVEEEVRPSEFRVYMPTVYGYSFSETGAVSNIGYKDSYYTVSTETVTVGQAYDFCYGSNTEYTFHYYMDGVQVSADTVLTKECTVVCVEATQDIELPAFTLSVYIDGQEKAEYEYTRPVAMSDAIAKYCKAKHLKMSDYVWTEKESVMASLDIYAPWGRDIEIYGYIYEEPAQPTSRKISVLKYDGETETTASYEIGLEMNAGEFIRTYLSPDFNDENAWENEYVFFYFGEYLNPIYGMDAFYTYDLGIFMVKTSVLSAGYTVTLDFMYRGAVQAETKEQTYHMPMTLRQIVYELGGYDIDWTTYEVTVNGKVLNVGDGVKVFDEYEINPQYKDLSVKVRPIYKVYAEVRAAGETEKTQTLTFYGEVTMPAVVEALDLQYTYRDYGWKLNGNSDFYWEESGQFFILEYETYLVIEARKVYASFTFVTEYGDELTLGSVDSFYEEMAWDWSVSVKAAYERIVGTGDGVEDFDNFTWVAKGPNGEFAVTAESVLIYIIPESYDYYDTMSNYRTVYSVIGTRKTVTVSVVEQGSNGETEKGTKTYPSTVTIGEILTEYGYTQDTISSFMVNALGGWSSNFPSEWTWDSVVTWPVKITVYKE